METNGQSSNGAGATSVAATAYRPKKGNRARPGPKPEEWAAEELRLGDEFTGVYALSVSEARLIVEATENSRKKAGKKLRETEPLMKMVTYMDTFARFRNLTTVNQLETVVGSDRYSVLAPFEKAQLISLCCATTDEARLLIPSLGQPKKDENDHANKISDEHLSELLFDINNQLQFTEE